MDATIDPPKTEATPWAIRVGLARRGWSTEVRLQRRGLRSDDRVSLGVWARTWIWAGAVADVCLHDHLIVDPVAPEAPARAAALLARVDALCRKAEQDFPDQVPCQRFGRDAQGLPLLAVDEVQTAILTSHPRTLRSTELIPAGIEAGADRHLDVLLAAASVGLEVEDSLDCRFGPPRFVRDCRNRLWGWRLRLALREFEGTRIAFEPQETTTRLLAPSAIAGLAQAFGAEMLALFALYGPHGALAGATPDGLPPGMEAPGPST